MIAQKLPDFNGGFVTKEVTDNFIITRDDSGNILNTEPVNVLRKGLRTTEFGRIMDVDGDEVSLYQNGKGFKADKHLLNAFVLDEGISAPLATPHFPPSKRGGTGLGGTFETPIGKVMVNNYSEEVREILTNPDKIVENARGEYTFQKSLNGKNYFVDVVGKLKGLSKTNLVKSLTVEEPLPTKPRGRLILKAAPKIFNINSGTSGNAWNAKGGVKPGHKYIERRPHPSGKGYIYLYKLPSGKTVWKDESGSKVSGGGDIATKADTLDYEVGNVVKRGNKIGKVIKVSDNFLAIDFEGKVETINKKEHLEKVKLHRQFKEGQVIDHDGKRIKLLRITDNLALGKNTETGELNVIELEREILPTKAGNDHDSDRTSVNKYSHVYQGYAEDERYYNIDYEDDAEYKDFEKAAENAGFGRIDDLTRRKFVKVGNETHAVLWKYDPEFKDVEFMIDGVREYKLNFMEDDYLVRDITEKGYTLEDPNTNETGIFLAHEDYTFWKNEKIAKDRQKMVIKKNWAGDTIISDSSKRTINYKPEYTSEELDRFAGKRRWGKKSSEHVQSEERKDDVQKEHDEKQKEIAALMKGEAYQKFKEQVEKRGFEFGANKFIARKTVNIEGRKFESRTAFDTKSQQYNTTVSGPAESVVIDGNNYPITDISEKFVSYRQGNFEKDISIKELKKKNGKTIFRPVSSSKGVVSSLPSSKIYFGTDDKNSVSGYYEVIEADDLVNSHLPGGEINPNYTISSAQNRDRTSAQSLAQINRIATAPNFDFLSDSRTAQDGAPVVNDDYNTIAGNGRGIGIKVHYENKDDEYKNALLDNAEKFGFKKEDLEKMKSPVLVRKVDVDNKEAQRLGAISNQDNKLALEERETAKGMATRIDNATFNRLSEIFNNAKGDFKSINDYLESVGENIIKDLVRKDIIPENERHLFFDQSTGKLNATHKEKLKNLLTQSVLGNSSNEYELIPDAAREGVTKALGDVFSLKGKEGDLVPHIQEAVKVLAKYNAVKDNFGSVDDFISQQRNDAFEPLTASKEALSMFELFAGKSPNEMKDKIRQYKQSMEGDMFGDGLPAAEAFDKVFSPKHKEGINKSFLNQLRNFGKRILKSIDISRNSVSPSKKNPNVRRWQRISGDNDQLGLFGKKKPEPGGKKAAAKEVDKEHSVSDIEDVKKKEGIGKLPSEEKPPQPEGNKLSGYESAKRRLRQEYDKVKNIETKISEYGVNEKSGRHYAKVEKVAPKFKIMAEYLKLELKENGLIITEEQKSGGGTVYITAHHHSGQYQSKTFRISDHMGRGGIFKPNADFRTFDNIDTYFNKEWVKSETEFVKQKPLENTEEHFETYFPDAKNVKKTYLRNSKRGSKVYRFEFDLQKKELKYKARDQKKSRCFPKAGVN